MDLNGFVASGVQTYISYLERIGREESDDIKEAFEKMMNGSIKKYLFTFGASLSKKSKSFNKEKYRKSISKSINKILHNQKLHMPDAVRFLDSGGFQVISGFLDPKFALDYKDVYYSYLQDNMDHYDEAFCLDYPPSDIAINSFEEIERLNNISYHELLTLPKEVQEKISVVYHFEDPKTNEYWYDLLFGKDKLFYKLNTDKWSVGGMVGFKKSDIKNPYIIYGMGLYNLVRHQRLKGINKLDFHVLGVSAYIQLLFMELIKKYLKDKYNFELNITYDSASTISKLNRGRYMHKFENLDIYKKDKIELDDVRNNRLFKIEYFMDQLNVKFGKTGLTREEHALEAMRLLYENFGTNDIIKTERLFVENETKYEAKSILSLALYDLWLYNLSLEAMQPMVDDIYNDFKNGNNVHDTTLHYIKLLNGGRLTKKSNLLAKRFHNTLRLFENLDNEDLANILIEQYLAPDSIKTFEDKNKGVLTW
jgi:hypothetical protein